MTFSDRLRDLIAASGLPQAEIARRLNRSPTQIQELVNGDKPNPTLRTMLGLLQVLDLDWDALKGVDSVSESNV